MQNPSQEKLRLYNIDGEFYPSVTSILSYSLGMPQEIKKWAAKISALAVARAYRNALKEKKKITQKELVEIGKAEPERLLKESQVKGTMVHSWAEAYYNTNKQFIPTPLPKEYKGYWDSFLKFNEFFDLTPIFQEKVLSSKEYSFAGRMDFYGLMGETRVLLDFKTSTFVSSTYGLQLVAYKHCLEQMGYPVDKCFILHLRSHGMYEFIEFNEDFKYFLNVRDIFDWKVLKDNPEFEVALTPEQFIKEQENPTI